MAPNLASRGTSHRFRAGSRAPMQRRTASPSPPRRRRSARPTRTGTPSRSGCSRLSRNAGSMTTSSTSGCAPRSPRRPAPTLTGSPATCPRPRRQRSAPAVRGRHARPVGGGVQELDPPRRALARPRAFHAGDLQGRRLARPAGRRADRAGHHGGRRRLQVADRHPGPAGRPGRDGRLRGQQGLVRGGGDWRLRLPHDAPTVHVRGIAYKGTIETSTKPQERTRRPGADEAADQGRAAARAGPSAVR